MGVELLMVVTVVAVEDLTLIGTEMPSDNNENK